MDAEQSKFADAMDEGNVVRTERYSPPHHYASRVRHSAKALYGGWSGWNGRQQVRRPLDAESSGNLAGRSSRMFPHLQCVLASYFDGDTRRSAADKGGTAAAAARGEAGEGPGALKAPNPAAAQGGARNAYVRQLSDPRDADSKTKDVGGARTAARHFYFPRACSVVEDGTWRTWGFTPKVIWSL